MKIRQIFLVVLISWASAFGSIFLYEWTKPEPMAFTFTEERPAIRYAGYFPGGEQQGSAPADFTKAATEALPAVVHIKAKFPARGAKANPTMDDFLSEFFGPEFGTAIVPEQKASGSGVIMSDDGYIITNDHVVADQQGLAAAEILVTLHNGKSYPAKLIGQDRATDIAVLKIDAKGLSRIAFGNSSELQTGQWALAIGYPLSLEATVTAGIISATGARPGLTARHVKNGGNARRSLIQTDAAVNTGSSGGALVNTRGELIGINTGILSPTGSYAGYSFAIPVNMVKKTVKDILEKKMEREGFPHVP